jgi:CarboxypepD_reg-like domain
VVKPLELNGLKKIALFSCLIFGVFASNRALAQDQRRAINFSGVILQPDSVNVLPGAHIYVPLAGRGTTSSYTGFFSLAVQTGDSVVISFVGYKRVSYIVPNSTPEFTTHVIVMSEEANELPTVEVVFPYPTEEIFKAAVLAMNIPMDANGVDKKMLNNELMALMIRTTPMDASANYRYYMNQYPQDIQNKFMPVTNPFLNVFNWAKFFKQMKQTKKAKDAASRENRIPD